MRELRRAASHPYSTIRPYSTSRDYYCLIRQFSRLWNLVTGRRQKLILHRCSRYLSYLRVPIAVFLLNSNNLSSPTCKMPSFLVLFGTGPKDPVTGKKEKKDLNQVRNTTFPRQNMHLFLVLCAVSVCGVASRLTVRSPLVAAHSTPFLKEKLCTIRGGSIVGTIPTVTRDFIASLSLPTVKIVLQLLLTSLNIVCWIGNTFIPYFSRIISYSMF